MNCLKMLSMHKKACKLILIALKSKEHSKTYIINATLHSPVHGFCMIAVVMLWSCWMQLLVAFLVVSFLKQYIGSDSCVSKLFVVFYSCSSDIYINPSYRSVLVIHTVNSLDTVKNIFDRVIKWIFSRLYRKSLMSHILKRNYLFFNLFLSQLLSCYCFIFGMIRAVYTAIYTII